MRTTDRALYTEHAAGVSYRDLATKYGLNVHSVRSRVSRAGRAQKAQNLTAATPTYTAPAIVIRPPAVALTDIHYVDPATDQGVFLERLHAARADGGYASVMHFADIHVPYQFQPALDVSYQIARHVQPTFSCVGSDFADFAMLSKFPKDPDEEQAEDALDQFQVHWNKHIDALEYHAPRSTRVYMLGNHDARIWAYVNATAPAIRHTVTRRFIDIIRAGGRVLWLGEVDAVRMGPLVVMHGNRANKNVAESLLVDTGYQVNVIAGHVHRLNEAHKRGEDFSVSAYTSGCLCQFPAHYHKRKKPTVKWQLGTAVAEVNLRGRDVHVDNLEYQIDGAAVWSRFERRTFSAAIPQPTGLISFEEYLQRKQKREAA
jgi:hypothetical protein